MSQQSSPTVHSPIEVPANHPSFAGHFPRFPVLPGVVLLDEALHIIERARGMDLKEWLLVSVKFLDAVRPGDALTLEHGAPDDGTIRFTIRAANRRVASGSLRRS